MSVDFIDTNVVVYLFDRRDERKRRVAERVVAEGLRGSAVISFQVVQETLAVLTRKLRPPMSTADARAALADVLAPLWRVHPSEDLYARALKTQEALGYGFYDSLIVEAARESGCRRLLSEDFQHGQRIGTLRIEDPFRM